MPRTPILTHSFTAADSTSVIPAADTGQATQVLRGTWGISSNQAYCSASVFTGSNVNGAVWDVGVSDVDVRVTQSVLGNNQGILVRAVDADNCFHATSGGATVQLYRVQAGVRTSIGSQPYVGANGDVLRVMVRGANWYVLVNNVVKLGPITDAFQQTATKVGIGGVDPVTNTFRWDNLAAYSAAAVTHPATWYVDPAGLDPVNLPLGTIADPISYFGMLNPGPFIDQGPGDVFLCRGGSYGHTSDKYDGFNCTLAGTALARVTCQPYQSEFPVFHVGLNINNAACQHVDFINLEWAGDDPTRTTGYHSAGPVTGAIDNTASTDVRFINCSIHDFAASGCDAWEGANQALMYGCYVYNNGFLDTSNGLPAGHGTYTQNDGPDIHVFQDQIYFNNYAYGIQCYGSSAAHVNDFLLQGNILFDTGQPGYSFRDGQGNTGLFAGGLSGVTTDAITYDSNMVYSRFDSGCAQAGYNEVGNNGALTVTKNQFWYNLFPGFGTAISPRWFQTMTVTDNLFVTIPGDSTNKHPVINIFEHGNETWGSLTTNFARNAYYGQNDVSAAFQYNAGTAGFGANTMATWQSLTGEEVGSSFTNPGPPAPAAVAVRPNLYQNAIGAPRAHIGILNFTGGSSVAVDLSSAIPSGTSYALYHVFDWVQRSQGGGATPTKVGTYQGGTVAVPINAVQPPAMVSNNTPGGQSQHDALTTPAPYFAAFVLVQITNTGMRTIGTTAYASGVDVAATLRVGDRYYVAHGSDLTPEKLGRQALSAGIWQGGDIFCSVANAYPDSVGPFYIIKSGRTGTAVVHNHAWEQLAYDANVRRTS